MWKKVKRVADVVIKEGIYTFQYLVRANLRAKMSAQKKYKHWQKRQEIPLEKPLPPADQPFISIILTGEGAEDISRRSLSEQNYVNWELLSGEEGRTFEETIAQAKGEYLAVLCRGDLLAEQALQELAAWIKGKYTKTAQLFYSDEDVITEQGTRKNPFFKPDYSPDTLRSFFYMGGFFVLHKKLAKQLTAGRKTPILYGGYLLALEASFYIEQSEVCHIPKVLYHRAERAVPPDQNQVGEAKRKLLLHYGVSVQTEPVADYSGTTLVYELVQSPKVSIIIPSKDNPELLLLCLDSIQRYTNYHNYELVIVDNGSSAENRKRYEALCRRQTVECRYCYEQMVFNFSKMCNIGANAASGGYYLFLNDDIEIMEHAGTDWLARLLGQAMQPHTGAVGAKLLYPGTKRIQHIGVVNYESGAAHLLSGQSDEKPLAFGRNRLVYNYSIVTGACLMTAAEKFWQAGGFDEQLAVTFNDVELCFRLLKAGYYQVVRNDVVLYHHESITRGEDAINPEKYLRHLKERETLFLLHPSYVKRDDFYSRNLTQTELDGSVNVQEKKTHFAIEKKNVRSKVSQKQIPFKAVIEYAQAKEQVCVRGFAFFEKLRHNNWNRTYVVLEGKKETLYVRTQKLYNPTIAPQMESKQNLNFAEFYTAFPAESLSENQYQIGIALSPWPYWQETVQMTGQLLTRSDH